MKLDYLSHNRAPRKARYTPLSVKILVALAAGVVVWDTWIYPWLVNGRH
jgi:hypothetical protein